MKLTIDIPDDLYNELKMVSAFRSQTPEEWVEEELCYIDGPLCRAVRYFNRFKSNKVERRNEK